MFGADPEFFFSGKDGAVVGSEKVLPKEGLEVQTGWDFSDGREVPKMGTVIVRDGVQGEFNVIPATCREAFRTHLRTCFQKLHESLKGEVKATFAQTVEVTEKEMNSLSEESQKFGCAPSKNAYAESKISIKDASKYLYRSAGGHIHIGHANDPSIAKLFAEKPQDVVRMLDILVGNTCVLLDRNPGNVERRKVYGKAGEYRLPKHGIEYRTLSNFWLRSYQVMSFVLAMVRFSVNVALNPKAEAAILKQVDMAKIQKAINENDFDLALDNFNQIKEIVSNFTSPGDGGVPVWPLQGKRMDLFEFFVERGLDAWFPDDVMKHWLTSGNMGQGWERFIDNVVGAKNAPAPAPASRSATITALKYN